MTLQMVSNACEILRSVLLPLLPASTLATSWRSAAGSEGGKIVCHMMSVHTVTHKTDRHVAGFVHTHVDAVSESLTNLLLHGWNALLHKLVDEATLLCLSQFLSQTSQVELHVQLKHTYTPQAQITPVEESRHPWFHC